MLLLLVASRWPFIESFFLFKTFQLNEINGQTPKISWGVKRNGKNRNERAASKLHSQESSNHRETVQEGKVTRTLTRSASRSNSPPRESFDIAQQGEQVSRLLMCGQNNAYEVC